MDPGTRIANAFWLGAGFKLLPASQGGYWLMGGLGETVVHVDERLERTDPIGFFGRLARAMVNDRTKRNSDFYYSTAGTLRRFGFFWVLIGVPVLVLPGLWWSHRREGPQAMLPVHVVGGLYLLGVGAASVTFWKLSGVFW